MKATLEFNLPEDEVEFSIVTSARDMYEALITIQQNVRAIHKYEELDEKQFEVVDRIYSIINENVYNIKPLR